MELQRLRLGLWRWTAPHPAWQPGAEWPREVGCLVYETRDTLVVIDPLVPAGQESPFWRALDEPVKRAGLPVIVVLTAPWHRRSSDEIAARYGAPLVSGDSVADLTALVVPPEEERQVALFLHDYGALVTAEILADLGDGLAVFPSPSLRDRGVLQAFLSSLLELPVELILPAHGPPVLDGARDALAAAIRHAPSAE